MQKPLSKEELQRQLNDIAKKEKEKFIEKNHQPLVDKFVGKFFKQQQSWGGGLRNKIWYKYTKVLSINPDDVYAIHDDMPTAHCKVYSFQQDAIGDINFCVSTKAYAHNLGEEISEDEFNEEWNRVMDVLSELD